MDGNIKVVASRPPCCLSSWPLNNVVWLIARRSSFLPAAMEEEAAEPRGIRPSPPPRAVLPPRFRYRGLPPRSTAAAALSSNTLLTMLNAPVRTMTFK